MLGRPGRGVPDQLAGPPQDLGDGTGRAGEKVQDQLVGVEEDELGRSDWEVPDQLVTPLLPRDLDLGGGRKTSWSSSQGMGGTGGNRWCRKTSWSSRCDGVGRRPGGHAKRWSESVVNKFGTCDSTRVSALAHRPDQLVDHLGPLWPRARPVGRL